MRDYKNVKVPRKYRTDATRVAVKRVSVNRVAGRSGSGEIKHAALRFLVIMVIAAGSWLGWQAYRIITHAEMFQISGVDVKGVQQLREADLKNVVDVFRGQNIFRADLDAAVRRAGANAWVKAVTIHRRLPNRISMVVTERVPYAVLDTGTGRFLMDKEGVIIGRVAKEKLAAWRLPVVAVKDHRAFRPGDHAAAEGIGDALMLLSEIALRGGWRTEAVTVRAGAQGSLSIVYANCEFKIGNAHYAEKLRRLAEIMADAKKRGLDIASVDLRPDRQAAVMVRNNRGRP